MIDGDHLSQALAYVDDGQDRELASLGLGGLHRKRIEAWFKEEPSTEWIQCVVHPYVYSLVQQHHHGAREERWVPEIVAPISFTVLVNRDGRIISHGRPGIARELLEPAAGQKRLTISCIDDVDHFFDLNEFPDYQDGSPSLDGGRISITEVVRYANRLLSESCSLNLLKPFPSERPDISYTLLNDCLIYRSKNALQAVRPLLQVMDAVQLSPTSQNWLSGWSIYQDSFASRKVPANHRTATLRLGMMANRFALSPEQHLCESGGLLLNDGDVLAINGPPGTGKTALLQSLVGSMWVKAALEGSVPPLVVLASTSNQAIINALNSLMPTTGNNESILKKRWIKGWQSNGIYLASRNRQDWATSQGYATSESVGSFEAECDLLQSEEWFLDCADRFLKSPQISLDEAVTTLQGHAKAHATLLRSAERIRLTFEQIQSRQDLKRLYGLLNRLSKVFGSHPKGKRALDQLSLWVKQLDRAAGSEARQTDQLIKAKKAFDRYLITVPTWKLKLANYVSAFESSIEEGFKNKHPAFSALDLDSIQAIPDRARPQPQATIASQVRTILRDKRWNVILQWIDAALDVTVRYQLFLLATHIHEGEWIIEMKNTLARGDGDRRSKDKVLRMWRRRARLAPALVSTLHNLPRVMNYWDPGAQSERPLLGELDCLIIDEAGQCGPEVAMPGMLLAKRVITIGDEYQLEPVRVIPEDVDGANAIAAGMKPDGIDDQMALSAMGTAGILSSTGSILKMTQQRSKFSQPATNGKGLMLTEHRRCRPSIIQFCNEACYEGRLNVLREPAEMEKSALPEIGVIHIPGVVESVQGSQINKLEAAAVGQWVEDNESTLLKEYPGKSLGEILGIITPFSQQARAIQQQLAETLGASKASDVLVGTVHSIQGAERPVIIFSPAYSAHRSSPMFFERSPNLLNVTVSRAQDHLIVMGDLQALSQRGGIVRKFSDHLWKYGTVMDFNLVSDRMVREARVSFRAKDMLCLEGMKAHTLFLRECLQNPNVHEITMMTPDLAPEVAEAAMDDIMDFYRRGGLLSIAVSMKHISRDRNRFLNITRPAIKTLMAQGVRVKMVDELYESGLVINDDRLVVTNGGYWMGDLGPSHTPRSLVMSLKSDSQEIQKVGAITTIRSGASEAA